MRGLETNKGSRGPVPGSDQLTSIPSIVFSRQRKPEQRLYLGVRSVTCCSISCRQYNCSVHCRSIPYRKYNSVQTVQFHSPLLRKPARNISIVGQPPELWFAPNAGKTRKLGARRGALTYRRKPGTRITAQPYPTRRERHATDSQGTRSQPPPCTGHDTR